MSTLRVQLALLGLFCLCAEAGAQDAETPPIDPYAESNEDADVADDAEAGTSPEPARESTMPEAPAPTEQAAPAATATPLLPAHPVTPPPIVRTPRGRAGLMGGLALGLGTLAAGNDSVGTLNYTLSFGGYLTHSLALLVDLWGGRHDDEDFHIGNHKRGLSGLYWLTDTLWTKASLASASYTTYVDDVELSSFSGLALGGGVGWVFFSRNRFHVDARISLSLEGYKDARANVTSTALQIGLHYF